VSSSEKSEKFSVSFPNGLLVAMDGYLNGGNRSAYLQQLAMQDLSARGVVVEQTTQKLYTKFAEILATVGPDAVTQWLDEIEGRTAQAAGTTEGGAPQ
jgi:hypothetical protein